jgi:hypothetical protein
MIQTDKQRRAMFARMGKNQFACRLLDPFCVTDQDMDFDRDGVPLPFDFSPLGNTVTQSGMTPFNTLPPVERTHLISSDTYADRMEQEIAPYIRSGVPEGRDFGDRLAAGLLKFWPEGEHQPRTILGEWVQNVGNPEEQSVPFGDRLEEQVAHLGDGIEGRFAHLGDGIEERFAHFGDGIATKIAGIYPRRERYIPECCEENETNVSEVHP